MGLLTGLADQVEAVDPWLSRFQAARLQAVAVSAVIVLAAGYVSWAAALALVPAEPLVLLDTPFGLSGVLGQRLQAKHPHRRRQSPLWSRDDDARWAEAES